MKKITILFILFGVGASCLFAQINPHKAPLYWSVYEHHIVKEHNGVSDNYIPESELLANINWVDQNLKSLGYNTICMDGWGDVPYNANGYRKTHSRHWTNDFAWWSNHLQSRGMKLGMYANPLWIHVENNDVTTKIVGTNINVSSLVDASENALWFKWVQVNRPGAEQYVKGYVKYYADMGIKYLRVDFLSWFETGQDRNLGRVGVARPQADYITALRWMREACDANGMFLSLVMPTLANEAAIEKQFGHSIRINEDTDYGEWWKFSDKNRGTRFNTWSQYANALDGFTYWSKLAGRDSMYLDGDFIRLNTFKTNVEKRSVISAHLLAGGPIEIADQYNTIGNDLWLYQNTEMLALNTDKFVAKPFTNDPNHQDSQIWTGRMTNGDGIIGLFNREATARTRSIDFSSLGGMDTLLVRDLWQHADLGRMKSISVELPPHGCMILKIKDIPSNCSAQTITFNSIPNKISTDPDFTLSASSNTGLPISYEIATGPATIVNNQVHLTGGNGKVFVVANQVGNANTYAAMPKVQSFEVSGAHQTSMYVAGTFSGWALNQQMTLVNGVWVARNVAISGGNHELKFANTNNWSGDDWGNAIGLRGTALRATGGAPNIKFVIATAGNFDIYFNDVTLQYSIGSPLAAHDLERDAAILMYPNPVHGRLVIDSKIVIDKINLIDIVGRTVFSQAENQQKIDLNLEHLPKGIYLIRFFKGTESFSRKIVIE